MFKIKIPIIVLVILMIFLLGTIFIVIKKDSSSNLAQFPISKFIKNPLNFSGTQYLMEGVVDSRLAYNANSGHIITFKIDENEKRVPVFIPEAIGGEIYVGQRYILGISITEKGNIHANHLQKY